MAMFTHKLRFSSLVLVFVFLSTSFACALWFELRETKEQLKLKYEMTLVDHGTGRVTAKLEIEDEGRLKPLFAVRLAIPSDDGSGYFDLSLPVQIRKADGKQHVEVHLKTELARRAQFNLMTSGLDGKLVPLTSYYYKIPFADYMKSGEPAKE
jgi:hypothetical protein